MEDKIAIVSGASKGIGRATALALADKGAHVVVNYSHSEDMALGVVEEVRRRGRTSFEAKADVSSYEEVEQMIQQVIRRFGVIHILVNNAGVPSIHTEISDIKDDEWSRILDTNLKGAFNCCKAVTKYMKEQKEGRIINVSSTLARMGNNAGVAYTASKAGIIGLTYTLAIELAPWNIHVNAVAPGAVDTGWHTRERLEKLASATPLRRIAEPQEIADAIMFLLTHDHITGEILNVDGGRYLAKISGQE
jgi:3-oxoacyl-[acyl-carrier protein] reductase